MWPVGTYDRLVCDIKSRENFDIPITLGLIIADYRQQKAREYVINYISRFDKLSGKYINFYLPGYIQKDDNYNNNAISVRDTIYTFDDKIYMEFLNKFSNDFEVEYPYNPVLILLEYTKGHFKNSRKIIIELDDDGSKIEKTGKLIEKIIDIARQNVSLKSFSKRLIYSETKENLWDKIVSCMDNTFLTEISDSIQRAKRYKIQ